jgi:hypothetical protein
VIQFIFVACILAGLYFAFIWPTQRLYASFFNLERNARHVITGTQLQQWAAGVLASPPTNATLKVADFGTNFPPQLLGLLRHPPYIHVQEADTNSPANVRLTWGSGFLGHSGFEIGPSNFASYRPNAQAWQPGVYFWTDSPKVRR